MSGAFGLTATTFPIAERPSSARPDEAAGRRAGADRRPPVLRGRSLYGHHQHRGGHAHGRHVGHNARLLVLDQVLSVQRVKVNEI